MTGRTFFDKYSSQINGLVRIINLLPKKVRNKRFESLRYKKGSVAMLKRYLYFRTLAKRCGKNVAIFPNVFFEHIENLIVGNNVSFHQMCYIDAEGGISIGDNVSIAHGCSILSSNHKFNGSDIPIKYQGMDLDPTIINNNVWIGCRSVVLAGTTIGEGCVIGANSTVTNSVPPNSVAFGTPCRVHRERIEDL